MKHTASAKEITKSNGTSTKPSRRSTAVDWARANFALCVETGGNIDLQTRKLYQTRSDKKSLSLGFVRVVDESGDDYLYPVAYFLPVRLSGSAAKVVRQLAEPGDG